MAERFAVWLGVGALAAGVSAMMLWGAGIAAADEPSATAEGATSSGPSKAADTAADGTAGKPPSTRSGTSPSPDRPTSLADLGSPSAASAQSTTRTSRRQVEATPSADVDGQSRRATSPGTHVHVPRRTPVVGNVPVADDPVADDPGAPDEPNTGPVVDDVVAARATSSPLPSAPENPAPKARRGPVAESAADEAVDHAFSVNPGVKPSPPVAARPVAPNAVAPNAVAPNAVAAPQPPTLVNVVGTLVFGLYDLASRLLEGPPVLPAGSTARVGVSTLHIDYGAGYDLPANWYFPADTKPQGLIYFQHGFLASAPLYSYTAATLAEQTHSIVVAPSVTSNFFAADGFWLGGAAYQQSVADLLTGERRALLDSAVAAGFSGTSLPESVVLAGHSSGGGLALGAAGYLAAAGRGGDLKGIVLLDGVANDVAAVSATLATLPADLPVYQIGSPPYAWNTFGATSAALVAARPGRFTGFELVNGSHIDAMQGGNPFFQLGAYLLAGVSRPQNIGAVKALAVGWIHDMLAEHEPATGIYTAPGARIELATPTGTATAIALPASESALSPFDRLLQYLFTLSQGLFLRSGSAARPL